MIRPACWPRWVDCLVAVIVVAWLVGLVVAAVKA